MNLFKTTLHLVFIVFLGTVCSISSLAVAQSNEDLTTLPSSSTTEQEEESVSYNIPNIDQEKLESAWFGWINEVRDNNNQDPYKIDKKLMKTSVEWSQSLADNNASTRSVHKRNLNDGFYDYKKISQRFKDRDIDTPVFSESVGWGYYKCNTDDCTESIIKSVKSTFSFFINESSRNGPHYRSIVSSKYSKVGLGISINAKTKKYFLVMHVSN